MSENMTVYEKVRHVPQEALKPINGGRLKGMSDINPMWRIKMLTEVFGMCGIGWKIEITDKRLEHGEGAEIVCFVDINLYVKVDGEWSAPIPGMGGSSFVTQERNGPFTSDECFKMAYTDAISVACKSLGFAADVYFANDRTKYSNQENRDGDHTPQKPVQNATQGQANQQSQQRAQSNTSQSRPPSNAISPPQIGLVKKLLLEKKIADDHYRIILDSYGVKSSTDLTKQQASKLIEQLTAYVPVQEFEPEPLPF